MPQTQSPCPLLPGLDTMLVRQGVHDATPRSCLNVFALQIVQEVPPYPERQMQSFAVPDAGKSVLVSVGQSVHAAADATDSRTRTAAQKSPRWT